MELKAEHVKNIRSLALCKELLRQAVEQVDQLNEELRHQKYKRCLAMAERCKESLRLMRTYEVTDNYWDLEPGHDAEYFCKKGDFYSKWRKRWLKIAEQFKEAK